MALVRLTTPALAAANAHCSRSGTSPTIDAMLMMRPDCCLRITRAAAWLTSYRPVRSTARIRSHSSRGNSSIVTRCFSVLTPALFTRMSSRPNSSTRPPDGRVDLPRDSSRPSQGQRAGRLRGGGARVVAIGVDDPRPVGGQPIGDRLRRFPGPRRSPDSLCRIDPLAWRVIPHSNAAAPRNVRPAAAAVALISGQNFGRRGGIRPDRPLRARRTSR